MMIVTLVRAERGDRVTANHSTRVCGVQVQPGLRQSVEDQSVHAADCGRVRGLPHAAAHLRPDQWPALRRRRSVTQHQQHHRTLQPGQQLDGVVRAAVRPGHGTPHLPIVAPAARKIVEQNHRSVHGRVGLLQLQNGGRNTAKARALWCGPTPLFLSVAWWGRAALRAATGTLWYNHAITYYQVVCGARCVRLSVDVDPPTSRPLWMLLCRRDELWLGRVPVDAVSVRRVHVAYCQYNVVI
jgi:hypothetical protein